MNRLKRLFIGLLCALMLFSAASPALAAANTNEMEEAAAYLAECGILEGDENGSLNLEAPLNRAELAVLLTRLNNGTNELSVNAAYFEGKCKFTDVPAWARSYVGYCLENKLVTGYDSGRYGAADPVIPAAACTVVLRALGYADREGSLWSYRTACNYAAALGWIDRPTVNAAIMTRGEMAVLLYRAMTGARPAAPQGRGDGFLANGKPVTERNVLELLYQIEKCWPKGTVWGTHDTPGTHRNEVPSTAANYVMDYYWVSREYGCSGYANMVSSLIFGDAANPARQVKDLSQIRPGDILIRIRNDTGRIWHVEIALESPNDVNTLHYTDGNCGEQVRWPDPQKPYSREALNCYAAEGKAYRIEAWTRYPVDTPYTGESKNAWGPDFTASVP